MYGDWAQWKRRHLAAYREGRSSFATDCDVTLPCSWACEACDAALEEWAGRHEPHRSKDAPVRDIYETNRDTTLRTMGHA